MNQPQYSLKPCTQEELNTFNEGLRNLLESNGLEMRVQPTFVPETSTNKFLVDAQVVVYKKVELELVEKANGPKEQGSSGEEPNNNENKAEEPKQETDPGQEEPQA